MFGTTSIGLDQRRRGVSRRPLLAFAGLLAMVLGSCAYQGDGDVHLVRWASWVSLVNGDDLRSRCTVATRDRYRVLYQNQFEDRVWIYEVAAPHAGEQGRLDTTVGASATALLAVAASPTEAGLPTPWRANTLTKPLSQAAFTAIRRGLVEAGTLDPVAPGSRFWSDSPLLAVAGCDAGRPVFHIFGDGEIDRVGILSVLVAHDGLDSRPFVAERTRTTGVRSRHRARRRGTAGEHRPFALVTDGMGRRVSIAR